MRAFVGIPVTEAAAGPMLRLQDALRLPRPVPEENLHLTLAFLDECDLPTLEQVNEGLEAIVAPAMVETRVTIGCSSSAAPLTRASTTVWTTFCTTRMTASRITAVRRSVEPSAISVAKAPEKIAPR